MSNLSHVQSLSQSIFSISRIMYHSRFFSGAGQLWFLLEMVWHFSTDHHRTTASKNIYTGTLFHSHFTCAFMVIGLPYLSLFSLWLY